MLTGSENVDFRARSQSLPPIRFLLLSSHLHLRLSLSLCHFSSSRPVLPSLYSPLLYFPLLLLSSSTFTSSAGPSLFSPFPPLADIPALFLRCSPPLLLFCSPPTLCGSTKEHSKFQREIITKPYEAGTPEFRVDMLTRSENIEFRARSPSSSR